MLPMEGQLREQEVHIFPEQRSITYIDGQVAQFSAYPSLSTGRPKSPAEHQVVSYLENLLHLALLTGFPTSWCWPELLSLQLDAPLEELCVR